MTFVRAKPSGWGLLELLTSAQANAMDSQLPFALDGRDGGSYSPSAGIVLDGASMTADYPLLLRNASDGTAALRIEANNGFGHGLELVATVNGLLSTVQGAALSQSATPATVFISTGASNTLGDGGAGNKGFGGATTHATSAGGRGLHGIGGNGSIANSYGGIGGEGDGGSGIFTGLATARVGAQGLAGLGGPVVGALATHWGGTGVTGTGGALTGTGIGGWGMFGQGANGPSASATGLDAGHGVVGRGYSGVLGVSAGLTATPLPVEFGAGTSESGDMRAAIRAVGKGSLGRAFISEFSGTTSHGELNKLRWIGAGGASAKTILTIEADLSSAPSSGTTYGVFFNNYGGQSFTSFGAIGFSAPAVELSAALAVGGDYYPTLQLNPQTAPAVHIFGGLAMVGSVGGPAGSIDSAMYMGSGSVRQFYDRIVGSGDSGASQAWARITTNGSGGITLGANYGISSAVLTNVLGTHIVTVTLDTIAGQPALNNYIGVANTTSFGEQVTMAPLTTTTFTLVQFDSSGGVDLATQARELHVVVYGAPAYGRPADRPTYYRP